jgi:hypothetical protein
MLCGKPYVISRASKKKKLEDAEAGESHELLSSHGAAAADHIDSHELTAAGVQPSASAGAAGKTAAVAAAPAEHGHGGDAGHGAGGHDDHSFGELFIHQVFDALLP